MIDPFNESEWEVVWSGSDPLLPPRPSKPNPIWEENPLTAEPLKRLYNKKNKEYWAISKKGIAPKRKVRPELQNVVIEGVENVQD